MTVTKVAAGPDRPTDTATRIEQVALQLFYEKGFVGASIRDITSKAEVGIATMFHHFPTKLAILERLLHRAVDDLQAELDEVLDGIGSPLERLRLAVRVLVLAHCQRRIESFVAQSELRSLEEPVRSEIRAKRLAVQHLFDDAVEAGVRSGSFVAEHPKATAVAILTLCIGVASWYRDGGPLDALQVAEVYETLALRMLGVEGV